MEIPIYQVDAFASRQFAGNPAAVCPLEAWLDDSVMQSIAAENNLAETAFLVGGNGRYGLRWFTPACEIELCGHATLASAYVLRCELEDGANPLRFDTRSGELTVAIDGERFCLDFPAKPPVRCDPHPRLVDGLGTQPLEVMAASYYMVVYASEDEVLELNPDFRVLCGVDRGGIIATAPGKDVDFVSRFFAPGFGIDEDPVTGSAHCTLTPYWSRRLGKKSLRARQMSRRGGELWCEDRGERVGIAGYVAPYLKGTIQVDVER